jgi:hypothetical protein
MSHEREAGSSVNETPDPAGHFTMMRAKAPRSNSHGARLCRRPAAAIATRSNAVNFAKRSPSKFHLNLFF